MDKLDLYRRIVIDLIRDRRGCSYEEIENYPVIDREGDHYQLMRDGWRNNYRHYGPVLHFDIKDGKISAVVYYLQKTVSHHPAASEAPSRTSRQNAGMPRYAAW